MKKEDEARNKRRSDFLGVSFSTANQRLRKMILFRLLRKCGENTCFKCKESIDRIEDLSTEHIKPWEGISVDLFWDLENIAFSHIRCNTPHRWGNPNFGKEFGRHKKTEHAPEGTAWCSGHKDYLLIEAFHSNERNVNGVASYCKECRKVRLD